MSVEVTFLPAGLTGLVAESTSVLDAARRMGVSGFAQCKGESSCMNCIVSLVDGAPLLSALTEVEQHMIQSGGLLANQRLACHARLERSGEVTVEIMANKESEQYEPERKLRKEFAELPLEKKLATLMRLELTTMAEALDTITNRSTSVGGKLLDKIGMLGKKKVAPARKK